MNLFLFQGAWRNPVLLFLLCSSIYILYPVYTQDTEPAALLPVTLLREGNITFNEFTDKHAPLPYWYTRYKGNVTSIYPIIPGLLNMPVALLAYTHVLPNDIQKDRIVLSFMTAVLIASFGVVLMYFCLKHLLKTEEQVIFFTLLYAFCTNVWATTSRALWQHGPSLLILNGVLLLLLRKRERDVPWVGILLGLLVWNRPTNIAFAVPLALFVLWKFPKQRLWFLFSGGCVALLFSLYSLRYYGSLMALGQGQPFSMFDGSIGINLLALLLNPSRGLLIYTPMFLFSIAGFWMLLRKSTRTYQEHLLLTLAFGLLPFLFIYAKWGGWWGGFIYGYRLLSEGITPLMLLLACFFLQVHWRRARLIKPLFLTTVILSFVVQYIGVVGYPCETPEEKTAVYSHLEKMWLPTESPIYRCAKRMILQDVSYRRFRLHSDHL